MYGRRRRRADGDDYLDSEVEPWLDVNPIDEDNLVGTWQQDRWSNGGARGLVAGASFDGGDTWQTVPFPGSRCAPAVTISGRPIPG